MKQINLSQVLALSLSVLALQGCVAGAAIGTGTAARVIADDRSVGELVDDITIANRIRDAYSRKNVNEIFHKVGVKVNEGRVLLNGTVANGDYRMQAAWEQKGVKEVINEINLSAGKDEGIKAISRVSKDSWITTQAKSKLLMTEGVHSVNFSLETIHGTVYVMGIAQNQPELDLVLDKIKGIKGVQKVISHVRVKDNS